MSNLKIIGISVETTNQNNQSATDIGALWGRFFAEDVMVKVPNKISHNIYSIYTDYESDYTGKYTTILGLEVDSFTEFPNGLISREFEPLNFKKYTAKGAMPQAVVETWKEIWANDETLNRSYNYDYEVYGERSQNGDDSEVDIFIGVK